MKIEVTRNKGLRDEVRAAIKQNGGYCPCSLIKDTDHKCMCKEFIEQMCEGPCTCGLYIKTEL